VWHGGGRQTLIPLLVLLLGSEFPAILAPAPTLDPADSTTMIFDRPLRKGDAGAERLLHLDQCSAPLRIPATFHENRR
jgi:hypothetical protein